MKSIQPFFHKKIIVLHQNASVQQAARAMREQQVGCVVISDHSSHIVGIATDRDLVNRFLADSSKSSNQVPLTEVMTRDPICVDEHSDLKRAVELMEKFGIRRIPVLRKTSDGNDKCVGMITLDDLIASKAVDLRHLTRIVQPQLKRKVSLVQEQFQLPENSQKELDLFFNALSLKLNAKGEFKPGELELLAKTILGAIVQKLHHTSALRFIAQLPAPLQESLSLLSPGPNDAITADLLLKEVGRMYKMDHPTSYSVLIRFCATIEEWCDSKTLDHIKAQLPKDFYEFFSNTESGLLKRKKTA
jgi:CBS domain-containing protein/uncharacterized protein (DUF2267 family)